MKRKQSTTDNRLLAQLRADSQILNPRFSSGLDQPIDRSSLRALEGELLLREGNTEGPHAGYYYQTDKVAQGGGFYHIALKSDLQNRLKDLEERFKTYQKSQVESGNKLPDKYPPDLEKFRLNYEAQVIVCKEEIQVLKDAIEPLQKALEEKETAILPRERWGYGELDENGILCRLGGYKVAPLPPKNGEEPDPTLYMVDDRSQYKGLPVYLFKSLVLGAMSREHNHRLRMEQKASAEEGRAKRKVPYPQPPVWHAKTNTWEFPSDWSENVVKKLKSFMD